MLPPAVKELHSRTSNYARVATGLASLVAAGIAQAVPLDQEQDGHFVQLPELTMEILPPRVTPTMAVVSDSVQQVTKMHNHLRQHFLNLLEASAVEDRDLA